MVSRRELFKRALAVTPGTYGLGTITAGPAVPAAIRLPSRAPEQKFDFETGGIEGWTVVQGQWAVEDMTGTPRGKTAWVPRATRNEYNVIVAPAGPFIDLD